MFGKFTLFKCFEKKVWQMNRSAKGLLIVTTILDDFSLVNHRPFTKFVKLSTCQTFLLYSNYIPLPITTLLTLKVAVGSN